MKWIDITEEQPGTGLVVQVKTIYGFKDIGIWDGKQWINSDGKHKGLAKEAPYWKLITKEKAIELQEKINEFLK